MQKIILFFGKKTANKNFYYKIEKKYNCQIIHCSYDSSNSKKLLHLEKGQELEIIKNFCQDKKIIAIVNKSDETEILHGKLVDLFKVPGPSYKALRLFKDKTRIHNRIIKNDLAFYRPTTLISTLEELNEDLKVIQYPVAVKPFAGAKSRGVFKLEKYEDFEAIYPLLKSHFQKEKSLSIKESKFHKILIEQYIKGKVTTAEYFVDEFGKVHSIFFTDVISAQHLKLGHMQNIYSSTPSARSEFIRKRIGYLIRKLVKISGLRSVCLHPEFFIVGNKVYFIELNVRMGGYRNILGELAYGISLEKIAFYLALGEKFDFDYKFVKNATVCELWDPKSGNIKNVKIPKSKYIKKEKLYFENNEEYIAPPEGNRPLGYFFILSEENSLKIAKKLRKKVKVEFL